MSFSIQGKTAIVTGAANGVGLAIARQFIEQGARVMLADMDEATLAHAVADLSDDESRVRVFGGDLRKKLAIANLISATVDAFDQIDILVNAARQVLPTDPLDPADDSIGQMLDQNLLMALRLSQAVARKMIKQGEEQEDGPLGTIVNLSSIAAQRTCPDLLGFSIASAAADQMTRALALALAPKRIRVNAVAFGSVMSESLKTKLKEHEDFRLDILRHTPLHRIGEASEVCDAVQYLASDASSFVTGQILTVDGGRTLLDAVAAPAH